MAGYAKVFLGPRTWAQSRFPPKSTFVLVTLGITDAHAIVYSADALTWHLANTSVGGTPLAIAWGTGSTPVPAAFAGASGGMQTSDLGINWSDLAVSYSGVIVDVAYSPALALFAACSNSSTGTRLITSSDALTWSSQSQSANPYWNRICWSPAANAFIVIGGFNAVSDGHSGAYSTDGSTWNNIAGGQSANKLNLNNWKGIASSNSVAVIVSNAISVTGNFYSQWSTDGINWKNPTTDLPSGFAADVCWAEGLSKFYCFGGTGTFYTSADGKVWAANSPASLVGSNINIITWSQTLGLLIGVQAGSKTIWTSPDGSIWTSHTIPGSNNLGSRITVFS